jgi:hypothetical protein
VLQQQRLLPMAGMQLLWHSARRTLALGAVDRVLREEGFGAGAAAVDQYLQQLEGGWSGSGAGGNSS